MLFPSTEGAGHSGTVRISTWDAKVYHWSDFLQRSFDGLAAALHETIGLLDYRWQYRTPAFS